MNDTASAASSELALLRLAAWLRRRRFLAGIYRKLPPFCRARVSGFLATSSVRALRFPRTPVWSLALSGGEPGVQAPRDESLPGVNIIGYVRGDFGLGESARMYARALVEAGIPVSLFDAEATSVAACENQVSLAGLSEDLPYETCIIFVNPDRLASVLGYIGGRRLRGKYLIACWFWELERIPDAWLPATEQVDEIMAPSRFIGDAIRHATVKPLFYAPQPVCTQVDSGLQRSDFGLEQGKFIFLVSFDFNSTYERKNPLAALAAFTRAFHRKRSDVCLLVKSTNGFGYPEAMARLLGAAADDPRIVIRDDRIDRAHVVALQRCCDAAVSLHRAEGFGLVLAEFMHMGKPVVATGWSGNMDFMSNANSCLVDYRLVPVSAGQYPGGGVACWAEPDVDDAANYMRRLVDEPGFAVAIGKQAAADIRRSNGSASAATSIRDRLQKIACFQREMNGSGGVA